MDIAKVGLTPYTPIGDSINHQIIIKLININTLNIKDDRAYPKLGNHYWDRGSVVFHGLPESRASLNI